MNALTRKSTVIFVKEFDNEQPIRHHTYERFKRNDYVEDDSKLARLFKKFKLYRYYLRFQKYMRENIRREYRSNVQTLEEEVAITRLRERPRSTLFISEPWSSVYEEDLKPLKFMFKNRTDFKNKNASLKAVLVRYFTKLLRRAGFETELTVWEFYILLMLYEFNPSQVINLGYSFNQAGIVPTIIFYMGISMFIQMPFNVCLITMVMYSKLLSLRLFNESIPLASVIRFPIFFVFLLVESRRLLNFEAMLKYMYVVVCQNTHWTTCDFTNSSICVPINNTIAYNINCTRERGRDENYKYYSTQYLVHFDIFRMGTGYEDNDGLIHWGNPPYYAIVFILPLSVIATHGMASLKPYIIKLLIAAITIILLSMVMVTFQQATMSYTHVSLNFFVNILSWTLQINSLPFYLWIARMKPMSIHTLTCNVMHQVFKFIMILMLGACYGIVTEIIARRYKMMSATCFALDGHDVIYAMIPESFVTYRFDKLFQGLFILAMLTMITANTILVLIASTHSFIQMYNNGTDYATLYMLLIVGLLVFLRLINDLPYVYSSFARFEIFDVNYLNNCNYFLLIIFIYFLYTPVRFATDYEIMYGVPPTRLWRVMWHLMVLFAFLVMIVTLAELSVSLAKTIKLTKLIAIIYIGAMIWTLGIHWGMITCKSKDLTVLFIPTIKWASDRQWNRSRVLSLTKEEIITVRDRCKHKCCLHLKPMEIANEYQLDMQVRLNLLKKTGVYQWLMKQRRVKEETMQHLNKALLDD